MPSIQEFIDQKGFLLLDGGLSTELELQGHDLNHKLWSAKLLLENPEAIHAAHLTFLEAGADCIISSSYQASMRGLIENGCTKAQARALVRLSYLTAVDARDEFWKSCSHVNRLKPLVAASIGPYGAYLADGSEYHGNYSITADELVSFHRERFEILADMADLFAIETIPSLDEAKAVYKLLDENPDTRAWVSFSCKDGFRLADGSPIVEAIQIFTDMPQVLAVGVNCCQPGYAASLIEQIQSTNCSQEIVVYPNRGEDYCAKTKQWIPTELDDLPSLVPQWLGQGARILGGCCRVSANDLTKIRASLLAN